MATPGDGQNVFVAVVGFRAHTGWAAAVTLSGDSDAPAVIDRRRLDLHDPRTPLQAYHAARSLPAGRAKVIIRDATRAAEAMARRALRSLCEELRDRGYNVTAAGLVLGSGLLAMPPGESRRSHAAAHAAEGEMYRQALLHAARASSLPTTAIAEGRLYEQAAAALKKPAERLRAHVSDLGRQVGAPWAQDQKNAALIAGAPPAATLTSPGGERVR